MAGEAATRCFSIFTNTVLEHCTNDFFNKKKRPFLALKTSRNISNCSIPRGVVVFASKSKTNHKPNAPTGFGKKSSKENEDPWESLFQQLEKDLENDKEDADDEDITEEDLQNFEKELEIVLRDFQDESSSTSSNHNDQDDILRSYGANMLQNDNSNDNDETETGGYDEDYSDDDFEEPRKVNLQRWQLKKLAAAAELGRRKVNIKSLAADLKLDRDDVLFFLKNPPPELLMIAQKMDEGTHIAEEQVVDADNNIAEVNEAEVNEESSTVDEVDEFLSLNGVNDFKKRDYGPRDWIKGKRLQKVQLATLERVYRRSKWPTNAMVQSLVQVTNLPRRRVLEWFQEERAKTGIKEPTKHVGGSMKAWKKPITTSFRQSE